ncbi:MAG TPA: alpha-hydroxy acid oxidase [Bryobacteraceae bacterium]|nr:alpha-hydroxy acid oxidase [Bryobacteraceae bacterium]
MNRRQALRGLISIFGAAPFLSAQDEDDRLYDPVRVMDFAPLAQAKLDPVAWDYLDGGSEDEVTLADNRKAFNRIIIRPRALVDVHHIDLSLELLGRKLAYPILLDPAGGKNCFYRDGEVVVARAAAASKALHITNGGIEDLVASGKGPVWWQIETGGSMRSRHDMRLLAERLEGDGCSGICISTDIAYVSHRDRNIRNHFDRSWCETGIPKRDAQGHLPRSKNVERAAVYPSQRDPTPTWDSVRELREQTKLPIIIKGILTHEDAERAVANGASAILVSNHGGRQLDHVGATIEALPEVVAAVHGRIPVLVDGGFRRGTDILKALALGATAICVARPYLYGLVAFGQRGVERVIELLRTELALDMALAGVPNLRAIDRSLVRIRGEAL